ncbi:MAG: DUF2341 domain-containing protein, partial [Verrucomicrobiota bacterium]
GDGRLGQPAYATNGSTWSESYEGVWHMTEPNARDSSPFGRHGAAVSAPSVSPGAVGDGIAFDITDDVIAITGYKGLTGTAPRTMSLWMNTALGEEEGLISWGEDTAGEKWVYRTETDGSLRVEVNGGHIRSVPDYSDGGWHYASFVWPGAGLNDISDGDFYADGAIAAFEGDTPRAVNTASNSDMMIGRDAFSGSRFFGGMLDEVRISSVARTRDWLWAEWYSMASNAAFVCMTSLSTGPVDPDHFAASQRISFCGYTQNQVLTNFPALVVFREGSNGFSHAQSASSTGGDLRITDASGLLELNYEMEAWNVNGASYVWVQVPALSSNAGIVAYWGNPGETNPPAYALDGSTWSEGYEAVWHFDEAGSAIRMDATGNGNHGVPQNFEGDESAPNAITGSGLLLDGGNDYLAITNLLYDTANQITAVTVESWVRSSSGASQIVASFDRNEYWRFALRDDAGATGVGWDTFGGGQSDQRPNVVLADGNWHHFAGTYQSGLAGNNKHIHVDGAVVDSVNAHGGVGLGAGNTRYGFIGVGSEAGGFDGSVGPTIYFNGDMDELRISSVARSADWLWALV